MGMFDYIETKMPLPAEPPPPVNQWFQTKDTEQLSGQLYMEKWTIEGDGRLIHHNCDYEMRPNEDAPEGSFKRWAGALKSINKRDEEHAFHGDINFYHRSDKTKEWWSYIARFTDGRCTKIWCDEYLPPDPAPVGGGA